MQDDLASKQNHSAPGHLVSASPMTWSVVVPYYNEADFLPKTLASLIAQELRPFKLILVDNGSTDDSAAICHDVCDAQSGIETVHLNEGRPGKIHALELAMEFVHTTFVATCDADTYYPPDYLTRCSNLFATGPANGVAVMALHTRYDPHSRYARILRLRRVLTSYLFARQAHTGGFGQSFRTEALRKVGGFSERHWPYVMLDHEIMHRLYSIGTAVYDIDLWCDPSQRRGNRKNVRWNFYERFLYFFTPFALKDWYFYRFLGPRLARRKLTHLQLRNKTW